MTENQPTEISVIATALSYFNGDQMAADVWQDKYAMRDKSGNILETTPQQMHRRMAKEFARIEYGYINTESNIDKAKFNTLSSLGQELVEKRVVQSEQDIEDEIFSYFDKFSRIVPQGSIMSNLGNPYVFGSLSNCFGIESPHDSYGGIMKTDQELVQLMKRRGGVGIVLDTLRAEGSTVTNAAKSSTGVVSFAERFSNTTREVAQGGRRGALMLLLSCKHPDIFKFVTMKDDRTKVTGANVSVMFTDNFMKAVETDSDFLCTFPVERKTMFEPYEYNVLTNGVMKIHAKDLFDLVTEMAWKNGEPGVAFIDRIKDYCPDGVYEMYAPTVCNPCFHPNTKISTVNGDIEIKDMVEPMKVYSMTKEGKLVIRQASASFISKKDAKTLKITVRSGQTITITPEHKIYILNKGWTEAKYIKRDDRVVHLVRSRRGSSYAGIYLTIEGRKAQRMEHKFLFEGVNGNIEKGYDLHHKDENTYNNVIDNLELLSHSKHATLTAMFQNPQTHQIFGADGKFITHPGSKKGAKTIIAIPERLKTSKTKVGDRVISIEEGETSDVYDIQVEDTHCLIANNIVAHNCGEQWFSPDETCRLIAQNFFTIVDNPFTDKAAVNIEKLYEQSYMQQRLGDDLVDLEVEHIDRILDKLQADPEPMSVKRVEIELWERVKEKARNGRRTGSGFTGLGDMLAALGVRYDSDEALEVVEQVMRTKMKAELDATIDMAILRGTFVGWDKDLEFEYKDLGNSDIVRGKNSFYDTVALEYPLHARKMMNYGRRNISMSNVAPGGSISLLTQTTSGLEPLFKAYHIRKRKIVPGMEGVRVDFVDQNGDSWMEYVVLHPRFKEWIKSHLKRFEFFGRVTDLEIRSKAVDRKVSIDKFTEDDIQYLFEQSPWYRSEADNIAWEKRIMMQAIIQRYTSNAISSTINLPENIEKSVVGNIYMAAYKAGLKGITVYRDGSRTGVLTNESSKIVKDEFDYNNAPKRPKELEAHYYWSRNGHEYAIIVGLLAGKPYEVFAFANPLMTCELKGKLIKNKQGHYSFKSASYTIDHLELSSDHKDEILLTRWVSLLLRHGANPKFIAEQVEKSQMSVVSFPKIISRILKRYIPSTREKCPQCGEEDLIHEEGCKKCICGYSAC